MVFYHIKECYDQFIIIHSNDLVQVLSYIRENLGSRCLYCSTVCNCADRRYGRYLAFFKRSLHTGCSGRLNTDDFDVWFQQFCQCGNTGSQSASSDRNKDIIYERKLLNHFHSDGSLAGCNGQIIERVNKGIAMLCCKLVCFCTCLIVHISVQNNLSAVALGTLYFDERCGSRHYDDSLCTVAFCRIRNALCMVSCRCGDQSFCALLFT